MPEHTQRNLKGGDAPGEHKQLLGVDHKRLSTGGYRAAATPRSTSSSAVTVGAQRLMTSSCSAAAASRLRCEGGEWVELDRPEALSLRRSGSACEFSHGPQPQQTHRACDTAGG
jgi:hypothetical protein